MKTDIRDEIVLKGILCSLSAVRSNGTFCGTWGKQGTFHTHDDWVLSSPLLGDEHRTESLSCLGTGHSGPSMVATDWRLSLPIYSGIPFLSYLRELSRCLSVCCCFLWLLLLPPESLLSKFMVIICFKPRIRKWVPSTTSHMLFTLYFIEKGLASCTRGYDSCIVAGKQAKALK